MAKLSQKAIHFVGSTMTASEVLNCSLASKCDLVLACYLCCLEQTECSVCNVELGLDSSSTRLEIYSKLILAWQHESHTF